jgi:4-hydroxyphenylacetate 3-monooxygenase
MGARSGSNYLSTLKKLNAEIWLGGERVTEVTSHPALRNCARSIASLYDMQMERVEQLTYRTDDGGRAGMSFTQPKSLEELRKRSRMMARWANFAGGMMLQTPDLVNVALATMASARDFFAASDPRYGDNIASYYLEARRHDWCATYAFMNLETRLVEKTVTGIIVRGAGMPVTLAPFAEELIVFPSQSLDDEAHALAFAIPCNSKGLKFLCRYALAAGSSHFDAPLASRFDVMDGVVIFEDVTVPWERTFLSGDLERSTALLDTTGASVAMMHQEVVKSVAQAEFMLGLAARLAEVNESSALPHIRAHLAEMIAAADAMRASLQEAETGAAPNQWGMIVPAPAPLARARDVFARTHPRMVEIIQLIGGVRLTTTADTAREHAGLYRLAWDATSSGFARDQMRSENASSSDSAHIDKVESALDLKPLIERIKDFLPRIS